MKLSCTLLILTVLVGLVRPETKDINTIGNADWIYKAGINKGKNHDRQDLGIVLQDKSEITIRQTNPDFKDNLKLELLCDDSDRDGEITFNSSKVSLKSNGSTVPFVLTPLIDGGDSSATPKVEFEVADTDELPIFASGDDQSDFLDKWDKSNAAFALIRGDRQQMLVPNKDKSKVEKLPDFDGSIDKLIKQLDGILDYYDGIIGLSNDTSVDTDKPSENRYFLRADINGAGGAYYSTDWTANTDDTIEMWLEKDTWGTFHEMAHGYQAGFDGVGMYTGEVSNNLFNVQYLYEHYSKDQIDDNSWLFNDGQRDQVDQDMYDIAIGKHGGYGDLRDDLRLQLVVLVMLKQKATNKAFTSMYQNYRKLVKDQGDEFSKDEYPLPELMNKYYSETSKYDFEPILSRWKLPLNVYQGELNRGKEYPAIVHLADIISKEKISDVRKKIDSNIRINSNWEVVDNSDLKSLDLGESNVQIHINNTSALDKLSGFSLKDGDKVIANGSVTDDNIVEFKDVPIGIYTLQSPRDDNGTIYIASDYYIYVTEDPGKKTISLSPLTYSSLVNQKFNFLGLGNNRFGKFQVMWNDQKAKFTVSAETPHANFKNEKYASVTITDTNGNQVYNKVLEGTGAKKGTDTFDLKEGYKVKIFHAEAPTRLVPADKDIDKDLINRSTASQEFTMGKYGLKRNNDNKSEDRFIKRIDKRVNNESAPPNQLYVAIESLSDTDKQNELKEKYKDLLDQAD